MRENIQNTNLAFFKSYFLPLANTCQQRANALTEDKIGEKSYQLIVAQIWALLPGFCNGPKDFNESFESVVKDLGKNLKHPELRMSIMAGLRQLVLKNSQNNRPSLSKWASKFLMELRNLYTIKPVKEERAFENLKTSVMFYYQRDSVMETIKLLLPLVDSTQLFDQITDAYFHPDKYSNYKQVEDLEFFKDAVYDLIRVMLKHQDQTRIENMYKVRKSLIIQETCQFERLLCIPYVKKLLWFLSELKLMTENIDHATSQEM